MNEYSAVQVLVASHNAFERRLVVDQVRGLGVRHIRVVDDAIEAYASMSLDPADVVVVDAEMRPYSGLQLARELRSSALPCRKRPIVLYTGELSRAFAEAAESAGVTDVLPKPVTIADLKRSLSVALWGAPVGERIADRVAAVAADRSPGIILKRADWELPAQVERAVREAVREAVDAARSAAEAWRARRDAAAVAALRSAVERVAAAAQDADAPARRAVAALRRVCAVDEPHSELLDATLSAARALALEPDRPALREALADALAEASLKKRRRAG